MAFVASGLLGLWSASLLYYGFALTVALVWIYTNLLRILAIFSQD